jgi:hypothetical protein
MPFKSVRQDFAPNSEQLHLMNIFKDMVNDAIRIGLENNASTLKKLSCHTTLYQNTQSSQSTS